MTSAAAPICEFLEWDSSFFDLRIARALPQAATRETVDSVLSWCNERSIDCLYFLANPNDQAAIPLLEDHGFRFVDIRLTLARKLSTHTAPATPSDVVIRAFRVEDVSDLRAIAGVSHQDSRFYFDSRFPRHRCDDLYREWIEKSCLGYADTVLVLVASGRVAGYLSCHVRDKQEGQIGLIAIDAAVRGRGLGNALVAASLHWFAGHGADRVSVVTQGRNGAAQRIYQRSGFLTDSVYLWYHRWFRPPPGDSK